MEADACPPGPPYLLSIAGCEWLHQWKEAMLPFSLLWPNLPRSSKGAIEQVTGLDLFARSREQPWCNPCSPPSLSLCLPHQPPSDCRLWRGGEEGAGEAAGRVGGHWRRRFEKEPVPILPLCLFIHRSTEYRTFCPRVYETDSLASVLFCLPLAGLGRGPRPEIYFFNNWKNVTFSFIQNSCCV